MDGLLREGMIEAPSKAGGSAEPRRLAESPPRIATKESVLNSPGAGPGQKQSQSTKLLFYCKPASSKDRFPDQCWSVFSQLRHAERFDDPHQCFFLEGVPFALRTAL